MPPDNEHDICECCGFQVGYNVIEKYEWDGTWWMNDREYPPPQIILNLHTLLAERAQEIERLRKEIEVLRAGSARV